jgi:hypothetical protein
MVNDITEKEVRKDVLVFANVLFERGMADEPLRVVDDWVRQWRPGALVAFRAPNGGLYWKPGDRQLEP